MRAALWKTIPLMFISLVSLNVPAHGGGVGVTMDTCRVTEASTATPKDTYPFHLYKVPFNRAPRASRDLEFLWGDRYRQAGKPLVPDPEEENDLDRFGFTLCEEPKNVFGFPQTDIQLVYDYLNARFEYRDTLYAPDPQSPGFRVAAKSYADPERTHADVYLWMPGGEPGTYPQYPSEFIWGSEDSLTADPTTYPLNAISIHGPPSSGVGDTGPDRWTRPDTTWAQTFNHEFEHAVNNDKQNQDPLDFVHMLASAAEVIAGMAKDPPRFDIRYTRSLNRSDSDDGNYDAWLSFAAYVAYNFRGVDLSGSVAGRSDDLLWRWAKQPLRKLSSLAERLSPAQCAECTTRVYFQGRSPLDRLHLLIHNWRVAQFVNSPSLADNQYGFPPQFGFDPIRDIGNWQNLDPVNPDSLNIPLEVTLSTSHITHEVSQAGHAKPQNLNNAHIMAMEPLGADYWVVRSDPSLWSANRNLLIRVAPDQISSGRVMVTAIAYSEENMNGQPDSLWKHPDWAQAAFGPEWKTWNLPGSGDERIELAVPGFGQTYKAVLVVVTASDDAFTGGARPTVHYRLNLALRTGSYMSPNPVAVEIAVNIDASPVFSPAGDEIAFYGLSGSLGQIYRRRVDGGPATPLYPTPANQGYPDWSPRGDWIAFSQVGAYGSDIAVYNADLQTFYWASTHPDHEYAATFSPDGQRLAYFRTGATVEGGAYGEIRVVALNGGPDSVLVSRGSSSPWLRWARDGRWIFFSISESLYAVVPDGPDRGLVRDTTELFSRLSCFDPAPGGGRFIGEVLASNLINGACPVGGSCPSLHRLVASDGPGLGGEALFYRTWKECFRPRWSLDGTRLVYISDLLGTQDIFVGQVGYNHAPVFANPYDGTVMPNEPFVHQFQASDPDGEPITWEAVGLPAGASLSSSGYFSWPNPEGPVGRRYYFVIRALDASGGVDHRVLMYEVISAPGGCPTLSTYTGQGWRTENTLLGRSKDGRFLVDTYKLRERPALVGERYRLEIRETEQERTTLDQVRLLAVDHDPRLQAFASEEGVWLGERRAAHRVRTASGEDVTHLLDGSGASFAASPGDILLVEMDDPAEGGSSGIVHDDPGIFEEPCCQKERPQPGSLKPAGANVAAAIDAAVLDRSGFTVESADATGAWSAAKALYPRAESDQKVVAGAGHGLVRVVFKGRQDLKFVGRLAAATRATPQELPLSVARHSAQGDVVNAVAAAGGKATTLEPGQTLRLEFTASPVPQGMVRDLFLVSRGVYTAWLPAVASQQGEIPIRFALAQNRPNPFSRTTTIRFELPVFVRVQLEVFDLLGRRMATLSDEERPAGFHAVDWDQRVESGGMAAPGVYIYRLTAGAFRDQKKMIVLP